MQSAATRGFTVVTVVTLIFTPMWNGKHWIDHLTGRKTETTIVKCQQDDPCPECRSALAGENCRHCRHHRLLGPQAH